MGLFWAFLRPFWAFWGLFWGSQGPPGGGSQGASGGPVRGPGGGPWGAPILGSLSEQPRGPWAPSGGPWSRPNQSKPYYAIGCSGPMATGGRPPAGPLWPMAIYRIASRPMELHVITPNYAFIRGFTRAFRSIWSICQTPKTAIYGIWPYSPKAAFLLWLFPGDP